MSWLNKYKLPKYQMMGTVPFAPMAAPQQSANTSAKKPVATLQQTTKEYTNPFEAYQDLYHYKIEDTDDALNKINYSYGMFYQKQKDANDFINLTQGRFKGASVQKKIIDDIIDSAKRNNFPIGKLLALAGRESTLGHAYDGLIDQQRLVSGWNLDENYKPYEPERFLADNKVPGVEVTKNMHGLGYGLDHDKVNLYLQSHPELLKKYQEKIAATKQLNGKNYLDLAIDFLKNKGIKRYNPGDPDYENKINKDYQLLSQDQALQNYLKQKGVTFRNGGLHKYQQDGLVIPGVTDFVTPRFSSESTSAGVPKRNAQIDDQLIARKQNETYIQI